MLRCCLYSSVSRAPTSAPGLPFLSAPLFARVRSQCINPSCRSPPSFHQFPFGAQGERASERQRAEGETERKIEKQHVRARLRKSQRLFCSSFLTRVMGKSTAEGCSRVKLGPHSCNSTSSRPNSPGVDKAAVIASARHDCRRIINSLTVERVSPDRDSTYPLYMETSVNSVGRRGTRRTKIESNVDTRVRANVDFDRTRNPWSPVNRLTSARRVRKFSRKASNDRRCERGAQSTPGSTRQRE